ncbi:hypothetical protein HZA96_01455 [Candidatus Woesearchaeota archaeon]|nr:hypothetical protein [Candidatus Woesearchaeota archaeon]
MQKTEDFAGKAFEFFAKHEKKENQQQKQIESFESFCKESDTVTTANTGFNPFARGNIEYSEKNSLDSSSAINNVITKTDHCKNKLKLIEYSCDNYKQKGQELFSIVDCEFGCDEQFGKCKN